MLNDNCITQTVQTAQKLHQYKSSPLKSPSDVFISRGICICPGCFQCCLEALNDYLGIHGVVLYAKQHTLGEILIKRGLNIH